MTVSARCWGVSRATWWNTFPQQNNRKGPDHFGPSFFCYIVTLPTCFVTLRTGVPIPGSGSVRTLRQLAASGRILYSFFASAQESISERPGISTGPFSVAALALFCGQYLFTTHQLTTQPYRATVNFHSAASLR